MNRSKDEGAKVMISLNGDQALVLYQWLTDTSFDEDPALQQVLWAVEGALEKHLVEPLQADYRGLVEQARQRLTGKS